MIFNEKGVDYVSQVKMLRERAIQTIHILSQIGFNAGGWLPISSRLVYKTFIRSSMEYGLQLKLLPKTTLDDLQKVQNLALRTMFSMGKTTSISAMHRLAQIETMQTRNEMLHACFMDKIHTASDRQILTQRIWDRAYKPSRMKKSLLWQEGHSNGNNGITSEMKKKFVKRNIYEYGKDDGKIQNYKNIGASIQVELNDPRYS